MYVGLEFRSRKGFRADVSQAKTDYSYVSLKIDTGYTYL